MISVIKKFACGCHAARAGHGSASERGNRGVAGVRGSPGGTLASTETETPRTGDGMLLCLSTRSCVCMRLGVFFSYKNYEYIVILCYLIIFVIIVHNVE